MTLIHDLGIRSEKESSILSREQAITECKALLQRLDEGVYAMDWEGPLPNLDNYGSSDGGIMEIIVQNKLKIQSMFQLKDLDVTKKVKIWNNDIKCIELWTSEQIIQLNSRLADIHNGTYYC